ncbi:MAG TPA: hypothetical protein VGB26_11655 [Nitrospiria bacterium]|jgi:hypothetical protein
MNGLNDTKNQILLVMLSFMTMFALIVGVAKNAHPASGCTGKITWIFADIDGKQIFTLKPNGPCSCQFNFLGDKGFINPPANEHHQQNYTQAVEALLSGKMVTVWHEKSNSKKNPRYCKISGIGPESFTEAKLDH